MVVVHFQEQQPTLAMPGAAFKSDSWQVNIKQWLDDHNAHIGSVEEDSKAISSSMQELWVEARRQRKQ